MEKNPWFAEWFNRPEYHQLYFERNEEEAEYFINHLLDYLQPAKESSLLDVACGKGRHSIYLAAKGFDVTGIDLSEASIVEALKSSHEHLHFFVHDMRLPFYINYFNYAFNFFTSFGYFDSLREHHDAIRTIAQSIKPNGVFVMDYLNTAYTENHLEPQSEKIINGVKFNLTRWHDEHYFYKKIRIEKQPEGSSEFTEKVRKFSLDDLTNMFALQNLNITAVFGDYQFNPYDAVHSPRMILVAKKG